MSDEHDRPHDDEEMATSKKWSVSMLLLRFVQCKKCMLLAYAHVDDTPDVDRRLPMDHMT